jgi:hypothetical protein
VIDPQEDSSIRQFSHCESNKRAAHSTTSPAARSIVCGIIKPSSFAVLRLMTSCAASDQTEGLDLAVERGHGLTITGPLSIQYNVPRLSVAGQSKFGYKLTMKLNGAIHETQIHLHPRRLNGHGMVCHGRAG